MPAHDVPKFIENGDGTRREVNLSNHLRSIETSNEEIVQVFDHGDKYVVITRSRAGGMFETRGASKEEVHRAATRGGR